MAYKTLYLLRESTEVTTSFVVLKVLTSLKYKLLSSSSILIKF